MTVHKMNFKIDEDLKNDFQNVCRVNHISMSGKLVNWIQNYVKEESDRFLIDQKKIHEFRDQLNSFNKGDERSNGVHLPLDFFSRG